MKADHDLFDTRDAQLKSRIVMNVKHGGGYDVKLTAPGRKEAKELVEQLNGAA